MDQEEFARERRNYRPRAVLGCSGVTLNYCASGIAAVAAANTRALAIDEEVVDLFTDAHLQPPYSTLNPNRMVPMREDGDLRLTESSAILKYLADLSETSQGARKGQRGDGLDHQLLSRLGLQTFGKTLSMSFFPGKASAAVRRAQNRLRTSHNG